MTKNVQMVRGTAAAVGALTGLQGQIIALTDSVELRLMDGSTAGGGRIPGKTANDLLYAPIAGSAANSFATLNLTISGNLSITASGKTVTLSPTGAGTVAISPTGALTINPVAASSMNNVVIGGSTPLAGTFTALAATTFNKYTLTAPATGATLTIADNKTFTVNKSITLAGTDSTTMTFPGTSASIARIDTGQTFVGTNAFAVVTATALTVTTGNIAGQGALYAGSAYNQAPSTAFAVGSEASATLGIFGQFTTANAVQLLFTFNPGTGVFVFDTQKVGISNAQTISLQPSGGTVSIGGVLKILGATTPAFTSVTTFTTGAGVSTGTLTNAPSVGNPTKWIKVDDAGVTRYVPAW